MCFPQIIMAIFYLAVLLWSSNQHGKHRIGCENFWITLVCVAAHIAVLWFGGFFGA